MARERQVNTTDWHQMTVGERIRFRRQHLGVRLARMAEVISYDNGAVSHIERGKPSFSMEFIDKTAQFLELDALNLISSPVDRSIPEEVASWMQSSKDIAAIKEAMQTKLRYLRRERSVGQRINRILAMAHLAEDDEKLIADKLAAITSELVAMIKAKNESSKRIS